MSVTFEDGRVTSIKCLQNITSQLYLHLEEAKSAVSDDILDFSSCKVNKLYQMAGIYSAAFKDLSVGNRQEFEQRISTYFRDHEVQESFDDLLQTEKSLNDLLLTVDSEMSFAQQVLIEGDLGPLDVPVINARSGEQTCTELRAAGGKVLIVSFGEQHGALRWLEETQCPFDMILDLDRNIYKAFGLFRSVSKVWNTSCLTYYADQLTSGTALPKPYEDFKDDPIQMGGNFVLDAQGFVKMSYPSKTSLDRPSIDHVLSVLSS